MQNLFLLFLCPVTAEEFLSKLGDNIAKKRKEAGMTQPELAARCDKEKQSINRLEKGRINPSIYYLYEIAQALNIPVRDLLDFE